MTDVNHVLYFDAPGRVSVRTEQISPPTREEVQVRTLVSAISPGTEMLFYQGLVPEGMAVDATLPGMEAPPTYPLRYGYSCVGEVCAVGDKQLEPWLKKRVFAFQPHMRYFNTPIDALLPIPEAVETEAAALFPNMETAISLVHDGAPLVGERIVVFGQGIVGLLTTYLLAAMNPAKLIGVDPVATRRAWALAFGAHETIHPEAQERLHPIDPDLIYELTGNPTALDTAVALAGYHARIIVGSWYGTKPVELALGHAFHRNRVTLYSSQVSSIPPGLGARWDKARRYNTAWNLLAALSYRELITHRIAIEDAQSAYEQITAHRADTLQILLTYENA